MESIEEMIRRGLLAWHTLRRDAPVTEPVTEYAVMHERPDGTSVELARYDSFALAELFVIFDTPGTDDYRVRPVLPRAEEM